MDYIANRLLEKEVIEEAEFKDIIKAREHLDDVTKTNAEA